MLYRPKHSCRWRIYKSRIRKLPENLKDKSPSGVQAQSLGKDFSLGVEVIRSWLIFANARHFLHSRFGVRFTNGTKKTREGAIRHLHYCPRRVIPALTSIIKSYNFFPYVSFFDRLSQIFIPEVCCFITSSLRCVTVPHIIVFFEVTNLWRCIKMIILFIYLYQLHTSRKIIQHRLRRVCCVLQRWLHRISCSLIKFTTWIEHKLNGCKINAMA